MVSVEEVPEMKWSIRHTENSTLTDRCLINLKLFTRQIEGDELKTKEYKTREK